MKVHINLSRKPFYNRKLFWLGFGLTVLLLTGFARWTLSQIEQTDANIKRMEINVAASQEEWKRVQKAAGNVGAVALPEEQSRQIQAAAGLIQQRKFSWTTLLSEFEREIPSTVRISLIGLRGNEKGQNGVGLRVKVFAKTVADITKMIAAADKRGVFMILPLNQTLNGNGDISFDLNVNYFPPAKPSGEKTDKKKHTHEEDLAKEAAQEGEGDE